METAREVPAVLPFAVLHYVANAVGGPAADRIRADAGETRSLAELGAHGVWTSAASALAIAQGAARITGDPEIARRGGEELFRHHAEAGVTQILHADGSVLAAVERVIALSATISVGRRSTVVDRSEDGVVVESVTEPGVTTTALLCGFAAGYWSKVPSVFGTAGYISEPECQARGDARCLTRLRWTPPRVEELNLEGARERSEETLVRIAELQATASELAAARDVDSLLDLIVARAGTAVLAPRFLLAVRLEGEGELRIRHEGFPDDATARRAAEAAVEERLSESTLSTEVASSRHRFGQLVAVFPEGATPSDANRRVMAAYAGHAAAALETVAALEQAQRERDTSWALLNLAKALALGATPADVSNRLATALPTVIGASGASVWLWEPAEAQLRVAANAPAGAQAGLPLVLAAADLPDPTRLAVDARPTIVEPGALTGAMHEVVARFPQAAVVPLVARGSFLGVMIAGFDAIVPPDEVGVLFERLAGCADLGATALDNARLVEQIRHQALHDALTGLANRPLIEHRANEALLAAGRTGGEVGVLFLDLDHFKAVNDTFGHHTGDALIRQVVARLSEVMRPCDTLARTGGDEFVVLVTEVAHEAEVVAVAERLIESIRAPFVVEGHTLAISCSIGIAVAPGHTARYETLMQRADIAMYEAKAKGRDTFAVHPPDSKLAPSTTP